MNQSYYERNKHKWVEYRRRRMERAPQCAAEDMCSARAYAKGLCVKHYKRWTKHGVLYSPKALAGLKTAAQRGREYYLAHREERIAYQTRRRNADLEAARADERRIYQRRRVKHQATNRARERKMGSLDRESLEYEAILRHDPCSYCGAPMEHIDHIDPIAQGGQNHWRNLTAACQPCNRRKWDRPLLAYFSVSGV